MTPDFFIVGAPKSATTAMYEYLRLHPEIYMPVVKELHYFGTDLQFLPPGRNFATIPRADEELARYLSFFAGAHGAKAVGEASVWYLYSEKAAQEIKEISQNARIIIMLRNPVDLLHAMHSQFLWEGNEDIEDFAQALAAEPDRKEGHRLPKTMHFRQGLFYRETIQFSTQVARYLNVFGLKNVLVLIYEDFIHDPHAAYIHTLNFLQVSTSFVPDFQRVNANKQVRSKVLRNMLIKPGTIVKLVGKALPRIVRSRIIKQLRKANTQYIPRRKLDPQIRSQLTQEFTPEIKQLQNVLNRDLSMWLTRNK